MHRVPTRFQQHWPAGSLPRTRGTSRRGDEARAVADLVPAMRSVTDPGDRSDEAAARPRASQQRWSRTIAARARRRRAPVQRFPICAGAMVLYRRRVCAKVSFASTASEGWICARRRRTACPLGEASAATGAPRSARVGHVCAIERRGALPSCMIGPRLPVQPGPCRVESPERDVFAPGLEHFVEASAVARGARLDRRASRVPPLPRAVRRQRSSQSNRPVRSPPPRGGGGAID